MVENGWRYYNHAIIPNSQPHEKVFTENVKDEMKKHGAYIARWTDNFDKGEETNWWYVIKDTKFDIDSLKSKRRYEINKGKKNFEVIRVKASDYKKELFVVTKEAYLSWPEKYRPKVDDEAFFKQIDEWNNDVVYIGKDRETGKICAYTYLHEYTEHLEFNVLRVIPSFEKKAINAAMVAQLVEDYNDRLGHSFYINDGQRSIRHETAFQDYLEKYFGFRKAYCDLHVMYRFPLNIAVKLLYPFRDRLGNGKLSSNIKGVLRMEMYKTK